MCSTTNNRKNSTAKSLFIFFLISQIILSSISVKSAEGTMLDNDHLRNLLYLKYTNTSDIVDRILSRNWETDHECLMELNAIKTGFDNREEWAMRVMDSWGNFPSGIGTRNNQELGSFSECFRIERSGQPYQTQYCVGQAHFSRGEDLPIFLGICLPATCTVKYLQSVVNEAIDMRNLVVKIPEKMCQREEHVNGWKPMDFLTVGLFGVVLLLMISSTAYDIFATMNNRKKYQPFIVFSTYTNGKKLFTCKKFGPKSGVIQCMDGIRVIATLWVVFNHSFQYYRKIQFHEFTIYAEFLETYRSTMVLAPLAADTFFVLSGLLVSYKMLKLLNKNGQLDIISLYWNRYLRLTPMLAVNILVFTTIFRFFGNGPVWPRSEYSIRICHRYWWSTLLHIQNYVNPHEMCYSPTWFLSVDFQLFIISPVFAYLIYRCRRAAFFLLLVLILCSICYAPVEYISNNITRYYQRGSEVIYFPTHLRFPPWLIGFVTGHFLHKYPIGSIRIPKKLNLIAWTVALVTMSAAVIANFQNYQSTIHVTPLEFGLYESLSRIVWSICLSYVIFACAHGSGGVMNRFLSLSVYQPLAKLSFSIYLIHMLVLAYTMLTVRATPSFSEMAVYLNGISIFVISAIISIPLVLAFELPIDAIYKLTMTTKDKNSTLIPAPSKSIQQFEKTIKCENFETLDETVLIK